MGLKAKAAQIPVPSTFAERFQYARLFQSLHGVDETDMAFAAGVGISSGRVSGLKTEIAPPPADTSLRIARRCGVDPGWLVFGEDTAAPEPEGFATWLPKAREQRAKTDPALAKKVSSADARRRKNSA